MRMYAIQTCRKKTHSPKPFKPTFFSSSSSSFHLAPRSLPTSPTRSQSPQPTSGTLEQERQTETRVGVLGPDPLAPVLAEEHVRRERTLGCLGVFLTCTATGCFLCFLDRLACLRASNISIDGLNARDARGHQRKECLPCSPWTWWLPWASRARGLASE
jgi:hypothetical protein